MWVHSAGVKVPGGRIVLDFRMPVFDIFYLSDFEARLGLADATMALKAVGPFGSESSVN